MLRCGLLKQGASFELNDDLHGIQKGACETLKESDSTDSTLQLIDGMVQGRSVAD